MIEWGFMISKSMMLQHFYVDMEKDFLEDEDAVKNKLEQYYKYIVKH